MKYEITLKDGQFFEVIADKIKWKDDCVVFIKGNHTVAGVHTSKIDNFKPIG